VIIAGELLESKISALAFQVQAQPQPGTQKNVQGKKKETQPRLSQRYFIQTFILWMNMDK
jgi:hypothetical protein